MPRPASSAAVAREKASCACLDAAYGPERNRARHRHHVDDVRAGAQAGQEGPQAPEAAQIVRLQDLLDSLRLQLEEASPAPDARTVDEHVDPRVPFEHARRRLLDCTPVGHVAELVLAADLQRECAERVLAARQQDARVALLGQASSDRGSDSARAAGDDGDHLSRGRRG
jgi:hypothetical protein